MYKSTNIVIIIIGNISSVFFLSIFSVCIIMRVHYCVSNRGAGFILRLSQGLQDKNGFSHLSFTEVR